MVLNGQGIGADSPNRIVDDDAVHAVDIGAEDQFCVDAEQATAAVVVGGAVGRVAVVDAEERGR